MVRYYEHLTHPRRRRILLLSSSTLALVVVARRWRLVRVEVQGPSMAPTLLPGDRLVIVTTRHVRPGQVIAVSDPRDPARTLVKRVAALGSEGVEIVGDNPAGSTDSRTFGPVPAGTVIGRAVYRYAPAERVGRIRGPVINATLPSRLKPTLVLGLFWCHSFSNGLR